MESKKTIVITITEVIEIKKGSTVSQLDPGIYERHVLYTQTFEDGNFPDINQLIRFANGEEPTTPRRRSHMP